ncbi:MAG TPA: GNAT family N-acetyltransferase [Ktedonobacteraceae bacterium]
MTMNTILQDSSPARVAQALDANMIAFGIFLSTLPHATLHDEPGLLWFETGVNGSPFNGVLQTRLAPEALPDTIERVRRHFQQRHLPFHWRFGPDVQPVDLGNLLVAHGIGHDEDEPGMAAELLSRNFDLPTASNLSIYPVTTADQVRQWSRTTYCGAPEEAIQGMFTAYSGLPLDPQSPLRLYLGTLDGKPVATSALFFAAGVAYIGRIVTVHAFRQRGIGTAITLHTMLEARRAGYHIAVLNASSMGINIYRRLGFKKCCLISTYEWYPIDSQ